MKYQSGKISGGVLTALVSVGVVVVLAITFIGMYVGANNYGIRAEKEIKFQYENMENVLGQYTLKIKEAAQIPGMQTDDLLKLFTESNKSRYGAGGSQSAMQWIKEHNPNLNQETYLQLQRLIEAGRNKFENTQTRFIDAKRVYETKLQTIPDKWFLSMAGFPKDYNPEKYKIISSNHAKDTFKTGVDEGLQLR